MSIYSVTELGAFVHDGDGLNKGKVVIGAYVYKSDYEYIGRPDQNGFRSIHVKSLDLR